jgi:peptidoglycan/xylan/chitin deacetylase (PgdA/CDA1 family)
VYYSGLFHVRRFFRREAAILLYHRVNDDLSDSLTIGVREFAEQMTVLNRYYSVIGTTKCLEYLTTGKPLPRHTVVIHFDDCYQDVATNAAPILRSLAQPACAFISSGFIGTTRTFAHDGECPVTLPNLEHKDIQYLVASGFEIGAHTINHVNLGQCNAQEAEVEVTESRRQLQKLTGLSIDTMSFPYGRSSNFPNAFLPIVQSAGYSALFSAFGGHVTSSSDLFGIPRIGASGEFRPLDMLMEIEGWSRSAFGMGK